jgi:hypothetical protein
MVGATAGIGILVGAIGRIRPLTLAPVLTAATLVIYVFYRPEVLDRVVPAALQLSEFVGHFGLALAILVVPMLIAVFLVSSLLGQHLGSIVAVTFGTMVLATAVLPTSAGGEAKEEGSLPATRADLPPIIHIILDEHSSVAGLPTDLPGAAAAEEDIRRTYEGFALYAHAYSRFAETKFSLASLMNGDFGAEANTLVEGDLVKSKMLRNAWFDELKKRGYAIRIYQSAWLDMCSESEAVDFCYTYPLFSPNAVQRTAIPMEARLRVLLRNLVYGKGYQTGPLASTEALMRVRADISAAPRGVAYIVHLLLPHYDYLYREDCSLADPSRWEKDSLGDDEVYSHDEWEGLYRRYIAQLRCTQVRMRDLFAHLKAIGAYHDATIVVHGDHGSRIGVQHYIVTSARKLSDRDLLDHHSTLLAVKAPGLRPGVRNDPVALQRVFADLFLGGADKGGLRSTEVLVREKPSGGWGSRDIAWPTDLALRRLGDGAGPNSASDQMH